MQVRLLFIMLLLYQLTCGQNNTRRVLFLGNSYTNANNLPQLVADVAASVGDTVIFDQHTPGGWSLWGHHGSSVSLGKIADGNWDFVVLQEQSQRPSREPSSVELMVYPPARYLDSVINFHNPCAETMFYMTWGRKNGDQALCAAYPNWPYVCTYEGMDSLLYLRYMHMADTNNAVVSPVGQVWRYIRNQYPNIELYTADESHPSLAGSYAAACSFYTAMFRKNPTAITFNSSLTAATANQIKLAVEAVVLDSLSKWNIGKHDTLFGAGCANHFSSGEITKPSLAIYPNPVQDKLSLLWPEGSSAIIQVLDARGKLLWEEEVLSLEEGLNVSGLSSGLYWIRLKHQAASAVRFAKN